MESRIKDCKVRCAGQEFFAGFYGREICWIVEWREPLEFFKFTNCGGAELAWRAEFLAAVHYAVPNFFNV